MDTRPICGDVETCESRGREEGEADGDGNGWAARGMAVGAVVVVVDAGDCEVTE